MSFFFLNDRIITVFLQKDKRGCYSITILVDAILASFFLNRMISMGSSFAVTIFPSIRNTNLCMRWQAFARRRDYFDFNVVSRWNMYASNLPNIEEGISTFVIRGRTG